MNRNFSVLTCGLLLLLPAIARGQAVIQFQAMPVQVAQPNAGEAKIDVQVDLNPAEQQFYDSFRPLLKSELTFVSRACHLDKEQRKLMADEGQKAIKQMARDAAHGRQGQVGGFLVVNGRAVRQSLVPRSMLQREIATVVKAKLPAELAEMYAQEQAKRSAFEKTTLIENTVAMIDAKVRLSAEQRDQIADCLNKTWKENDLPQAETFMYGNDFMPPVADRCVVPFLRDAQKAVWQNRNMLNSGRIVINGGGLILNGVNGFNFIGPGGGPQIELEDEDTQ